LKHFFARRYATAVYAMAMCPAVRPSVCHKSEFYQNVENSITQTAPHDTAMKYTLCPYSNKGERQSNSWQ